MKNHLDWVYWLSYDGHINLKMIDLIKTLTLTVYLGTNQDAHRTNHIIDQVGHFFKGCFASYLRIEQKADLVFVIHRSQISPFFF